MTLRAIVLGCGSSGGVPRIGGDWGQCDPHEPRNRRRRCALLIERETSSGRTRVLIDTPPDLREQLLAAHVGHLDAVLFTHDHADHTHGIDDLRILALRAKRRIDVYMDEGTASRLESRFDYCFKQPLDSAYPPILSAHRLQPLRPVVIEGKGGRIELLPIPQSHGEIGSLGFRVGGLAYSPDVSDIGEEAVAALRDLDVWIVDALRYIPHPSHFSVKEALAWIERLRPKRGLLTHLHVDLDYATLKRELPAHVEPAYDGLVIELEE